MLEGRSYKYNFDKGLLTIKGDNPEGWDDLSTEDQMKEVTKLTKITDLNIRSLMFDKHSDFWDEVFDILSK